MVCMCVAMVAWACAQDVSGLMEYLEGLCDTCLISPMTPYSLSLCCPGLSQPKLPHGTAAQARLVFKSRWPTLS